MKTIIDFGVAAVLALALTLTPVQDPRSVFHAQNQSPATAGPTWTLIQHPNSLATCQGSTSVSSGSCTVSGTATGANHGLVVLVSSYDAPQTSSPSVSVVGNNGGDTTFTHCNAAGHSCGLAYQYVTANWETVDAWYIANTAGGTTSITATVNFGGALGSGPFWAIDVDVIEFSRSTGTAAFDDAATSNNGTSSCTSCAAPSLTLSGSSDYILHWHGSQNGCSAISGAFTNPFDIDSTTVAAGFGGALNQSSGTGPTWTCNSGKISMAGLAFK